MLLSNQGKTIYDSFDDVIILQFCHRIRRKTGEALSAEDAKYNDDGRRFLEVMNRLRDCTWTVEDYFWLCERKLGRLSPTDRADFVEAPLIMEFRKARDESDEANDSCDQYNRRKLHALALEKNLPVARFTDA